MTAWTPVPGDYVYVQRKRARLAAGRVTSTRGEVVSVRLTSGKYVTVRIAQVTEHPQNRWGRMEDAAAAFMLSRAEWT